MPDSDESANPAIGAQDWLWRLNKALIGAVRSSSHPLLHEKLSADIDQAPPHQLSVLFSRIGEHQPVRMSELAEIMELDRSTIGRQVLELVNGGLVQRLEDPTDRRSVILVLTRRGSSVMHEIWSRWRNALWEMTAGWSEDQRQVFLALFERMALSLEEFVWDGDAPPGLQIRGTWP